jgi:hypothetical protein
MKDKELTIAPTKEFSVESLLSQAISNNVPVETLERLLAMREKIKAEMAREAFNSSMAAFQADCPVIRKTKEVKNAGGSLLYTYAPIDSIVNQVKALLKKHGFSYSTNMELMETGVKVAVKVTHVDGHFEVTDMEVPFGTKTGVMSQTQVVAAAQTFAKRYAFCNAFGILTGDEDNDTAPTNGYDTSESPDDVPVVTYGADTDNLPGIAVREEDTEEKQKGKILFLAKALGSRPVKPAIEKLVKELTGFELKKEHYPAIIKRLEAVLKNEQHDN